MPTKLKVDEIAQRKLVAAVEALAMSNSAADAEIPLLNKIKFSKRKRSSGIEPVQTDMTRMGNELQKRQGAPRVFRCDVRQQMKELGMLSRGSRRPPNPEQYRKPEGLTAEQRTYLRGKR